MWIKFVVVDINYTLRHEKVVHYKGFVKSVLNLRSFPVVKIGIGNYFYKLKCQKVFVFIFILVLNNFHQNQPKEQFGSITDGQSTASMTHWTSAPKYKI